MHVFTIANLVDSRAAKLERLETYFEKLLFEIFRFYVIYYLYVLYLLRAPIISAY